MNQHKKGKESPFYKDRIGEKHITNSGEIIEIIESSGWNKNTIKFLDGTIVKDRYYSDITSGSIKKPIDRVGEKHISNEGYKFTIIETNGYYDNTIEFENGVRLYKLIYQNIKNGEVKNPYHRSICGVGYTGIGKHPTSIGGKITKMSRTWRSMIERVHSKNPIQRKPTYKDVNIYEKWECFQNFGDWFEKVYNPKTMQNWELDKDILIKGNKIYSPETCCLVPDEINCLFTKKTKNNGLPTGVTKRHKRFTASLSVKGDKFPLGTFDTMEEAFQAYKTAKEFHIKRIADKWKELIEPKVYQALYNWKIEITD